MCPDCAPAGAILHHDDDLPRRSIRHVHHLCCLVHEVRHDGYAHLGQWAIPTTTSAGRRAAAWREELAYRGREGKRRKGRV